MKGMRTQIWYSPNSKEWRWTLSSDEDIHIQESGGQTDLREAMNDIASTIEYLLETKFPD